jgi:hypothetical protein
VRRPGSRWSGAVEQPSVFSGRTYAKLARIVRELCAVAGRRWLPLAAAVAVAVAVAVTVAVIRAARTRLATFPARPWSLCAAPLPIGLTAADLFAGGEVSRADSRARRPGNLSDSRCPAVTSALDAGPEAYHNPAAVWWGPLHLPPACRPPYLSAALSAWNLCRPSPWRAPACTVRGIDVAPNT